jgi:hypothetical protein
MGMISSARFEFDSCLKVARLRADFGLGKRRMNGFSSTRVAILVPTIGNLKPVLNDRNLLLKI